MKTNRMHKRAGAALVEFALVLPLLFVVFLNAVNFGGFFFAWITVANAARTAANYMIMGGASVNSPPEATAAQISAIVTTDISSLLNRSSLAVRVCTRSPSGPGPTGTAATPACTVATGTFATTPPDVPADTRPEAPFYIAGWVDVDYTYIPFIPLGFRFPGLGLRLTLPNNLVIHRRAVMRIIR